MKDLKRGSRGSQVAALQRALINLGYDLGRWGADGDFGAATAAAVKKFQKDNNIPQTSIVDQATRAALFTAKTAPDYPAGQPDTDPHLEHTVPNRPVGEPYSFKGATVVEIEPHRLRISAQTDRSGHQYTEQNAMTAAFLGHHADKSTYPTSMLASGGKILNNTQPNGLYSGEYAGKGIPAPTFIVYQDGKVAVEVLNDIKNKNVRFAVSGMGVVPRTNQGFPLSLVQSVAYQTFRVGLGWNPVKNRVFLMYHPKIGADAYGKLFNALGCNAAITTDSGGSALFKVNGKFIRSTIRRIPAVITW